MPLDTIEFYKAKKKDDMIEKCDGGRQLALSNLANFEPPKNLEDGTVLIYSLIVSSYGPDCCESVHPLPLMHGQFEVVLGVSVEAGDTDADANAGKPDVGNDGSFLRVQSFKASEDEDLPKEMEIASPMRRHLCR